MPHSTTAARGPRDISGVEGRLSQSLGTWQQLIMTAACLVLALVAACLVLGLATATGADLGFWVEGLGLRV